MGEGSVGKIIFQAKQSNPGKETNLELILRPVRDHLLQTSNSE